jgi:hypothetical protein
MEILLKKKFNRLLTLSRRYKNLRQLWHPFADKITNSWHLSRKPIGANVLASTSSKENPWRVFFNDEIYWLSHVLYAFVTALMVVSFRIHKMFVRETKWDWVETVPAFNLGCTNIVHFGMLNKTNLPPASDILVAWQLHRKLNKTFLIPAQESVENSRSVIII